MIPVNPVSLKTLLPAQTRRNVMISPEIVVVLCGKSLLHYIALSVSGMIIIEPTTKLPQPHFSSPKHWSSMAPFCCGSDTITSIFIEFLTFRSLHSSCHSIYSRQQPFAHGYCRIFRTFRQNGPCLVESRRKLFTGRMIP
jgi:hypothetical protein